MIALALKVQALVLRVEALVLRVEALALRVEALVLRVPWSRGCLGLEGGGLGLSRVEGGGLGLGVKILASTTSLSHTDVNLHR